MLLGFGEGAAFKMGLMVCFVSGVVFRGCCRAAVWLLTPGGFQQADALFWGGGHR